MPVSYTMGLQIAGVIAMQVLCTMALQMASLGSSYAAGPGLRQNYAKVLAGKLGADLTDLSVSGTTLLSMSSQINRIPKNADIITVTSGGNDLNYIGGLTLGIAGTSSVSEQQLVGRFNDDLAKIHTKAPKARVYLVEYLTILGPDVKPGTTVSFSASQVESHRRVAAILQKATEKAAEGKDWVTDVPVASQSQGHGLGSKEPWVNGNRVVGGGAMWHPNTAGMNAVAGMIYDVIKKEPKKARL
jgi:lysophospholipase L1-like esterase